MHHAAALDSLQQSLDALKNGALSVSEFCRTWRSQAALRADLPERYTLVQEDLLGRLEAGSLFTEESCSFSQEDLIGNLTVWLDKARQTIEARKSQ
jgi:hypothetical protein